MSDVQSEPIVSSEKVSNRMVGQVKWFNNKAGYGFITVSDGENAGKDIFAHYSTIDVADSEHQYRYLVQGEYVEFDLSTSKNNTHEYQSSKISGIKGGKLMCETRQGNNRPIKRDGESTTPLPTTPLHKRRPSNKNTYATVASKGNSRVDKDGFEVVRKRKV